MQSANRRRLAINSDILSRATVWTGRAVTGACLRKEAPVLDAKRRNGMEYMQSICFRGISLDGERKLGNG